MAGMRAMVGDRRRRDLRLRKLRRGTDRGGHALGRGLAGLGVVVLCGGLVGVMTAVSRGAAEAGGTVVGVLPNGDWRTANPWVTIPIATGIGVARNAVIARAALALVAVGGGYGTLSEIAFGLQDRKSTRLNSSHPSKSRMPSSA